MKESVSMRCPRCNHFQKFIPDCEEVDGLLQVSALCKICRYRSPIRTTTRELENLRSKRSVLQQAIYSARKRGLEPQTAMSQLSRIEQLIIEKQSNLQKETNGEA